MIKKLIGIAIIALILGIILGVGIRGIKARPTHPAKSLQAVALHGLSSAAHSNLLLVDLKLRQAHAGLGQRLLPATQVNNALHLSALQDLLTPDALTQTNLNVGLLGLNS